MILRKAVDYLRRRPLESTALSALLASLTGLILPGQALLICSLLALIAAIGLIVCLLCNRNISPERSSRRMLLTVLLLAFFAGSISSWLYFHHHLGRAEALAETYSEEAVPLEGWCIANSFTTD